jgi:2-hydroxy-3-keto-5-methylthiopentenyl-1-phosphate phosphatase
MTIRSLTRNALRRVQSDLFWATDLDSTAIENNMGPVVDTFIGVDRKKALEQQYHDGKITNEQYLGGCVEAMYEVASQGEITACCLKHAKLMPHFAEFRQCLADHGVDMLALTNNVLQCVGPILEYLGIDIPVIGNIVENGKFVAVHKHICLNKGRPIRWLVEHGHQVVGFGGDGIGDRAGARMTSKLGGTVVVVGKGDKILNRFADYHITDYNEVIPLVPAFVANARRRLNAA